MFTLGRTQSVTGTKSSLTNIICITYVMKFCVCLTTLTTCVLRNKFPLSNCLKIKLKEDLS